MNIGLLLLSASVSSRGVWYSKHLIQHLSSEHLVKCHALLPTVLNVAKDATSSAALRYRLRLHPLKARLRS